MGYYTNYEINIETHNSGIDTSSEEFNGIIANRLSEISDYEFDDDLTMYNVKWYDWHEHMIALSNEYPSVLFIVDGNGEEDDDIWRAYITGGKSQVERARLSFAPFDENKLK